jgi:competence ComEA-like helix-hairpin-helix protein
MTSFEARSASRAALILLVVSLARLAIESRDRPSLLPDDSVDVAAGLLDDGRARARDLERRSLPLAPGERLDVNEVPAMELDRLPRVGPALADAIVAERDKRPFTSIDDLVRVRGIGPATLERLRTHVTVAVNGFRPTARARPAPVRKLSLARASSEDFENLPGIGPALAARIVRTREARGGFTTVDELLTVPGIGPARLDALRDLVRVP